MLDPKNSSSIVTPKKSAPRNPSSLVNMAWCVAWCMRSKEDHFCGVEDAEHWESDTWHELCWQSAAIPNALPHRSQPYNSLQPPTTPTTPSLQHNTIPPQFNTQTPQYNPSPSSERPLSWKMSPFYPTLCLLRIFTEVSAPSFFLFFRCPGNMPPLVLFLIIKKNFIFIDFTCEDSLHLIWRAARPWSPEMSTPGQHSCPSPF